MREMAVEKGMTLVELNKKAEADNTIDDELDKRLKRFGKGDNFVIDGRLTAFFIPHADVKIFLDADDEIRAKRIMKDKRAIEKGENLKQTLENIEVREASEKKRYKEYYGVDYHDKKLYDFIINTTSLSAEEVVGEIIKSIQNDKK